jgi:hypothetical protein
MNIQQILSDLHDQRRRLDQAIAALDGHALRRGRPPKKSSYTSKPRTMSLAAPKRIGEAKRRWWANKKVARKKPHITAAGRKRLSALMKKRWAERKKAKG